MLEKYDRTIPASPETRVLTIGLAATGANAGAGTE
jgi:hypothetical protein